MKLQSLLTDMTFELGLGAVVAGTSDQTISAAVDMTGFEGVTAVAILGDVTDTAVVALDCYEVATNATSGGTQVTASSTDDFTANTTSGDSKILISERFRPTKQYVYFTLDRGTANAVINSILIIKWNANTRPVTQPSTVIASKSSAGN